MIEPSTRLGPYEIISCLGKGGMGEVYRAKDTRLGREVAIKLLRREFSSDRKRLGYFQQEARAASALNHPNIVTIYDIGESDLGSYIAMELVDGTTLRNVLKDSPLPTKKVLQIASQVADGLAKAHAAGIVHRDLKPENLMLARDGVVKILDFGLAKLTEQTAAIGSPDSPTAASPTELGIIVGTPGYMSPEQASGHPVDFRSDQFSLGTILYEMSTGKHAFERATAVETLSAIIRDEPEPVAGINPKTPAPFRWVIERCLAKETQDRYSSTLDLARELQGLRDHLFELLTVDTTSVTDTKARSRTFRVVSLGLAILFFTVLIGLLLTRRTTAPQPHFRQLTFGHGNITGARFAADGQSIIYGAAWVGNRSQLYMTRPGSPESRSLGLPNAGIWSVSPNGEMAIASRCTLNWAHCVGTLALVPSGGGAPHEVLENVHDADWSPDGKTLAVAQYSGGMDRLLYPAGQVLYETSGWITYARVSPKGDRIAFLDHSILGQLGGSVSALDLAGNKTTLSSGWSALGGLAWHPDGNEVWFTGSREAGPAWGLHAVSLSGRVRENIHPPLNDMYITDISRDGRQILVVRGLSRAVMVGRVSGEATERDLSLFDWSTVADLSSDGKTVLFYEWGTAAAGNPIAYLRKTDGSDAVRLGEGKPLALSPDGKWAITLRQTSPPQLVMLPTGPGEPRKLPRGAISEFFDWATWAPDSERIFFAGQEPGQRPRTYMQDIQGESLPQPITPEGLVGTSLSPDGSLLTLVGRHGGYYVYKIGTEEPDPLVAGFEDGDTVLQWSSDNRFLFLRAAGDLKLNIFKLDRRNGSREFWKELTPPHPAGLIDIAKVRLTPDGTSYVYTYWTFPSELYLVEGLK